MGDIVEYFKQSELALAAYATLTSGVPDIQALKHEDVGMSDAQARRFARDWRVVDQYTHTEQTPIYDDGGNITGYLTTSNGLTVTVFQEVATGKRYLAIRGTEATSGSDIWTDLKDLVAIGTPEHQSQYQSLKAKIEQWLADPAVLQGRTFTVAGHSLGGFLAAAVASHIAGLDETWGAPASAEIEAASGLGLDNHSIVRLNDALAIHAAYAGLAPALTLAQTGQILRSASERNTNSLEAMLDALRKTLLGADVTATPEENRDALYAKLYVLQDSAEYQALKDGATLMLTATQNDTTLVAKAMADAANDCAWRRAA